MKDFDFDNPLTAEEANSKYLRAQQDYKNASKKPYLNALDRSNRHLSFRHAERLGSHVVQLEFLSMQPAVLSGLAEAIPDDGIFPLQMKIMEFLGRFPNTGVRIYKGRGPGL